MKLLDGSFFKKKKKEELEVPLNHMDMAAPDPKSKKYRPVMYALPEGAAWNPLTKFPKSHACWCGSKVKAKRCCQPRISRCISIKLAQEIKTKWPAILRGQVTLPRAPEEEQ